ncbi:unnamed protein product [Rotaria magnacalcarata]|uniref:Uncharacterized protein n=5 Tax=Rotaria magnacalcarata TaxID=392030 RepID=A0A816VEG3_9BILA|nr:unnamed protein product [Rotaria magnacalcarata]CAF2049143.1 unnamed protein product [Rotaria magnacalcarata]CAF2124650.1 unnamed protein product [Rotaria magnacalcarata]CAF4011160.1 unnamed protein product [Rotaria magnacalcarata]CAF4064182.1 unnamed protein product [Rotaria magnacalcarata]
MSIIFFYLTLLSLSLTRACEIFAGMTCTCYESIDVRCTMPKIAPLAFVSPFAIRNFQTIDLKINSEEHIRLDPDYFILLNKLFTNTTQHSLSITLRFQNFYSFHAKTATFRNLFQNINTPYSRFIIELHPLKAKSIIFEPNTFDNLNVHELSIYADSLTSSFESIFNNTNILHLNIEGATVAHDPSLLSKFTGQIRSLKVTRMIDSVNSEEFPPFPVQSYTIEAHKMRKLNASSFLDYKQLTGLNIIQPDISITPQVLHGLEKLSSLRSISFDAERIADGALKYAKHIQTLILGSYLRMLDTESLNLLTSLKQLDVRYVQFSTLQANTSCALADYINRRRMLGLTVYLPHENIDCDCILVFLNAMVDDGDQLIRCQSTNNDRCLFSSCPIVSEYFNRKQIDREIIDVNTPAILTPSIASPVVDFNEQDSPYYLDSKEERTTVRIIMEPSIYDEDETLPTTTSIPTTTTTTTTATTTTITPFLTDPEESSNDFSTPLMKRLSFESKTFGSSNYLIVSWIPFAIIASCLFLTLLIAMISYIIYHQRHTVSFKLIPQTLPII